MFLLSFIVSCCQLCKTDSRWYNYNGVYLVLYHFTLSFLNPTYDAMLHLFGSTEMSPQDKQINGVDTRSVCGLLRSMHQCQ